MKNKPIPNETPEWLNLVEIVKLVDLSWWYEYNHLLRSQPINEFCNGDSNLVLKAARKDYEG